eukprot:Nk52_evm3s1607 gene=Nk52_evmTU3s1607
MSLSRTLLFMWLLISVHLQLPQGQSCTATKSTLATDETELGASLPITSEGYVIFVAGSNSDRLVRVSSDTGNKIDTLVLSQGNADAKNIICGVVLNLFAYFATKEGYIVKVGITKSDSPLTIASVKQPYARSLSTCSTNGNFLYFGIYENPGGFVKVVPEDLSGITEVSFANSVTTNSAVSSAAIFAARSEAYFAVWSGVLVNVDLLKDSVKSTLEVASSFYKSPLLLDTGSSFVYIASFVPFVSGSTSRAVLYKINVLSFSVTSSVALAKNQVTSGAIDLTSSIPQLYLGVHEFSTSRAVEPVDLSAFQTKNLQGTTNSDPTSTYISGAVLNGKLFFGTPANHIDWFLISDCLGTTVTTTPVATTSSISVSTSGAPTTSTLSPTSTSSPASTNSPPSLNIANLTAYSYELGNGYVSIDLTGVFSDDGGAASLSYSSNAVSFNSGFSSTVPTDSDLSWLSRDTTNLLFSGVPFDEQFGAWTFDLKATDAQGLETTFRFTIDIAGSIGVPTATIAFVITDTLGTFTPVQRTQLVDRIAAYVSSPNEQIASTDITVTKFASGSVYVFFYVRNKANSADGTGYLGDLYREKFAPPACAATSETTSTQTLNTECPILSTSFSPHTVTGTYFGAGHVLILAADPDGGGGDEANTGGDDDHNLGLILGLVFGLLLLLLLILLLLWWFCWRNRKADSKEAVECVEEDKQSLLEKASGWFAMDINLTQKEKVQLKNLKKLLFQHDYPIVDTTYDLIQDNGRIVTPKELMFAMTIVFEGEHREADLFEKISTREITTTVNRSNLFLSQSISALLFEIYTELTCDAYLKSVLNETIKDVCGNMEEVLLGGTYYRDRAKGHRLHSSEGKHKVNPYKDETFGNWDDIARGTGVGSKGSHIKKGPPVRENEEMERLLKISLKFIDMVIQRTTLMPDLMRFMFYCVGKNVEGKFPGTKHSAIGDLFFTRFICKALSSPHEFNVCGISELSVDSIRTLRLVAALLQCVGTGLDVSSLSSFLSQHPLEGVSYLRPVSEFIATQRPRVYKFFDQIANSYLTLSESNLYKKTKFAVRRSKKNGSFFFFQRKKQNTEALRLLQEHFSVYQDQYFAALLRYFVGRVKLTMNSQESLSDIPKFDERVASVTSANVHLKRRGTHFEELVRKLDFPVFIEDSSPDWKDSFPPPLVEDLIPLRECLFDNDLSIVMSLCSVTQKVETDELANSILILFQKRSQTMRLLKEIVHSEVSRASSPNAVLLGQGLSDKILQTFCRTVAKDYLCETLGPVLRKYICLPSNAPQSEYPLRCEIDPSEMLQGEYVTDNAKNLMFTCKELLTPILKTYESLPHAVLLLCAQIGRSVEKRFPIECRESERISMCPYSYIITARVIFIRYICSALASPFKFSLVSEPISKEAERILSLCTKVFQALANHQTFDKHTSKFPYMSVMNNFIVQNSPVIKKYCKKLIDTIPREEVEIEMIICDRDSSSSNISRNIELQALTRVHKYLITYIEDINFIADYHFFYYYAYAKDFDGELTHSFFISSFIKCLNSKRAER